MEQAMLAYTRGGAWANFIDHDRGSLSPGKLADLVVLSDNVFDIEPAAVIDTRVDLTMVGGRVVFERS